MGYTRRVVARLMAMACALYLGSLIRLLSELSPQGAGPGASMHAAWLAGGLARRGLLLLTGLPTLTAYAVQQHWANGELAAVLVTTCCTLAVWRVPVSATEGRRPPASEPAPPPAAAAAAAGPRPFQLPPPHPHTTPAVEVRLPRCCPHRAPAAGRRRRPVHGLLPPTRAACGCLPAGRARARGRLRCLPGAADRLRDCQCVVPGRARAWGRLRRL
jgi:hypothetical protein